MTNPKGWEQAPLGIMGGFKNGLNFSSRDQGINIHCLGVGDFKNHVVISGVSALSEIALNELPAEDYLLKDGDIVFVRSNGNKELVGRSVVVYPGNSKATFGGFCIRLRLTTEKLNTAYLIHTLHNPSLKKSLLGSVRGANITNLNQQMLGGLEIPLPPISLQNEFAAFVEQADKSKFALQITLAKLEATYKALLNKHLG